MPAEVINAQGLTRRFGSFTAVDNVSFVVSEEKLSVIWVRMAR
jgi:ABC-type branched-subunit amino acid transport system ATPase component